MSAPETSVPDSDGWLALHRDSLKVTALFMLGVAIGAGVPTALGISGGAGWAVALTWVLSGATLLIVGGVIVDYIRLRKTRYRLTDERMELRKGILFTQRRSLARERIRAVDLNANPLLRPFGLVTVSVGTGEQSGGAPGKAVQTLVLDPVSRTEGERLRAILLDRPLQDGTPGRADGQLSAWRPAWIRYAPLSIWTPALAGLVVGGAFQVSGWAGQDGLPYRMARDAAERYGVWTTLIVGAVGFVLLGVIGTLALTAEGWWNFRLDREPGGTLRVRRGLLTTRSLSLEERRIRGVDLVEPLGVRLAGAARLDVIATGLKRDDGSSEQKTLQPAAPREHTLAVAADVAGIDPDVALAGHPTAARARRLRWAAMAILALAAIVVLLLAWWSPSGFWTTVIVAAAVVAAVALVVIALDAYRGLGHALGATHLVARRGSVRRTTAFLERDGVIGWKISQSIFQRRAGLMTVTATTAAGSGQYSIVDADDHEVLDVAAEAVPGLLAPFLVGDQDAAPASE